jgi:hypothetical protein
MYWLYNNGKVPRNYEKPPAELAGCQQGKHPNRPAVLRLGIRALGEGAWALRC